MATKNYIPASILVLITSGLSIIISWGDISGPHMADIIVPVFSALCLAGLGLIMLKGLNWIKWVLLIIIFFEFFDLIEAIRFRSVLTVNLSLGRWLLHLCAMILLFIIKDKKKEKPQVNILPEE